MIYDQEHAAMGGSDMDEPVPRRSFVRLVSSDVVHNAGRLAALSGAAAGIVAQGVASLAGAVEGSPPTVAATGIPTPPPTGTAGRHPPAPVPASAHPVARLDAGTRQLLGAVDRGWLAVNRRNAGPLVLPAGFRFDGDRLSIRGRTGSAMALAVAADAHVTLIVDDAAHDQRCLVFGRAEVLEGAAAAWDRDEEAELAIDEARIVIEPTHALRMPA
jgi:hypothetical protein